MWYRIDAVDRISAVSSDWQDQATQHGAPELSPTRVIGRPIWQFLEGEVTFLRYAALFEAVRQTGRQQTLRFGSSGVWIELILQPLENQSIYIVSRVFDDARGCPNHATKPNRIPHIALSA